jgi:hypothetical protein
MLSFGGTQAGCSGLAKRLLHVLGLMYISHEGGGHGAASTHMRVLSLSLYDAWTKLLDGITTCRNNRLIWLLFQGCGKRGWSQSA